MEKNNKGKKQLVLKPVFRILITIILFLLLCLSVLLIYIGKNPDQKHLKKYYYNISENIDYKVYLKENDFFEEKYLGPGKQYTSAIIDYIDIDFTYIYDGSLPTDMNYKYEINASIIGEYENAENGNAELWKKNYPLHPEEKLKTSSSGFNIKKNVKINYSEYSRVVDNFKSNFKLAIDAYLSVKLTIKYDGTISHTYDKIDSADVMEIKIPLSKATTKISTNYVKKQAKHLKEITKIKEDQTLINIGISIGSITLLLFLILSPKLFFENKNHFRKRLAKIMKEYSEIIVEVESELTFEDLEIIDIKTFEDMVDIEEGIKSPILYYEIEKDNESWFVITTDKYLYRYILRR